MSFPFPPAQRRSVYGDAQLGVDPTSRLLSARKRKWIEPEGILDADTKISFCWGIVDRLPAERGFRGLKAHGT